MEPENYIQCFFFFKIAQKEKISLFKNSHQQHIQFLLYFLLKL